MSWNKIKVFTICLAVLCLALTGCKSDFNPYKHMHLIMTATGLEDYEDNANFVDKHTSESLQGYVQSLFLTISGATVEEREIYVEEAGNTVKLLGCYIQRLEFTSTAYWAYFVYENDVLVTCHIYPMQVDQQM